MDKRLQLLEILGITEDMLLKVAQGRAILKYEEQIGSISPFNTFRTISNRLFNELDTEPTPNHNFDQYPNEITGVDSVFEKARKSYNSQSPELDLSHLKGQNIEVVTKDDNDEVPNVNSDSTDVKMPQFEETPLTFQVDEKTSGWSKVEDKEKEETKEEKVVEAEQEEKEVAKTPIQKNIGSENNQFTGNWGTTPIFSNEKTAKNAPLTVPSNWMDNPWEKKK